MNFEKKNNVYKAVMLIIVTALITFLITSIGMHNYYNKGTIISEKNSSELETKIAEVRKYLDKYYIGEITSEEKLNEYAVKGYVAGIDDEYTEYLTENEYKDLMINLSGNYVGIGVYIAQDKYENVIILMPIEGSPAEAAELKSGDTILKIDGEECTGMDLDIVANKIQGEEGSTVELEILRQGKTYTKKIERKRIEFTLVKSKVLENNIGYINILSFDEGSSKKVEEELNKLMEKGIESLIIDVRDNPGGIVDEVEKIADLFLGKGKTILIEKTKNNGEIETKTKKDAKFNKKIVVLSNQNSASGSEILIGALKENEVAQIVGTKTYGKGRMQEVMPIDNGALKITIEEFFTPNRNVINKKGIEPDIVIEDNKETQEDEQLQKAIEILK